MPWFDVVSAFALEVLPGTLIADAHPILILRPRIYSWKAFDERRQAVRKFYDADSLPAVWYLVEWLGPLLRHSVYARSALQPECGLTFGENYIEALADRQTCIGVPDEKDH